MLGVNDNRSTDLARYIKTRNVSFEELQVGDIVVDDHNVWHVTGIKEEEKWVRICEQDDNDRLLPWDLPPKKVTFTIIDRRALDSDSKKAVKEAIKEGTKWDASRA